MNAMLFHLHLAGVLIGLLVIVNLVVPSRYHWREELASLSLLNRRIFQVHSIFILIVLGMLSALLLTCGAALLTLTTLSRAILIGLTVFWSIRLWMQFFFYDRAIWRGKRFETIMHVIFSMLWVYLVTVFSTALYQCLVA